MNEIAIDVDEGEIRVDREGINFSPLREDATSWSWSEIHHLAFEPGDGRGPFRRGLIGLMTRPRARVFLTTDAGDLPLRIKRDVGELRAIARRITINVPDARGKVTVAGEPVGPSAAR